MLCSKIPHTQITIFRETKLNILLKARHKSESNLVKIHDRNTELIVPVKTPKKRHQHVTPFNSGDHDHNPTSFYVIRVTSKPPCVVVWVAFLAGIPGIVR